MIRSLIALLLICGLATTTFAQSAPRRQLAIIVCEGLTLDEIYHGDRPHPTLLKLVQEGSVGLMNCATGKPHNDTAAMLALACGEYAAPQPGDEQSANDWEKFPQTLKSAADVYRERMGLSPIRPNLFDPMCSVKATCISDLRRRGLNDVRLGALLGAASPKVSARIVGNADQPKWQRRAALLGVNAEGVGAGMVALRSYDVRRPFGLTDDPYAIAQNLLQRPADVLIAHLGDGARAEAARPRLSEATYQEARRGLVDHLEEMAALLLDRLGDQRFNLLIVSPRPPALSARQPEEWSRLTPIVGYGPDFPAGMFRSASTRTPGLVCNIDFAPTILRLYSIDPPAAMIGRTMSIEAAENAEDHAHQLDRIERLDRITGYNAQLLAPMLAILGVFVFVCVVVGAWAARRSDRRTAGICAIGLIGAMNFPAALLFAPLLMPGTPVEYGIRIAVWAGVGGAISYAIARMARLSAPVGACALNLVLILSDCVSGQRLIKDALVSNYYLPGFRFYGIGNDFLGIVLAFSLAGAFSLVDDLAGRQPSSGLNGEEAKKALKPMATVGTWALVAVWAAIAIVLGWPRWGANSGSLVACGAAFGVGWLTLRGDRRAWLWAVPFAGAGMGCSLLFAYLDSRLFGANAAHAGAAITHSAGSRGIGYLIEIASRKLTFNLSLFALPWTWVTITLISGALLLLPMIAEEQIEEAKERRAWLARSVPALSAAVAAAFVFKDSGVTTVCYVIGYSVVVGCYYLLTPNLPARVSH